MLKFSRQRVVNLCAGLLFRNRNSSSPQAARYSCGRNNKKSHIDRLYFWLGLFTDVYLLLVTFEFFSNFQLRYPALESILDALSEPYLGALAVYTVLKEIRKRSSAQLLSLHRGERYVLAWLLLLAATTIAVIFTERYSFEAVYKLIIANSLSALMIYLGSRLHRP